MIIRCDFIVLKKFRTKYKFGKESEMSICVINILFELSTFLLLNLGYSMPKI